MLAAVIDHKHKGEIRLLLVHTGEEEYVWNIGHPLEYFLVLPCPVVKVNGKLQ